MTTIVSGRSEVRTVLEETCNPSPHLAVDQVTPPAVGLTPGLVTRRPLRVEVNPSVIKAVTGWCMNLAPSELKGLAHWVGLWLATWAIRATTRQHSGQRVRHRSQYTLFASCWSQSTKRSVSSHNFALRRESNRCPDRLRAPWIARFQGRL